MTTDEPRAIGRGGLRGGFSEPRFDSLSHDPNATLPALTRFEHPDEVVQRPLEIS